MNLLSRLSGKNRNKDKVKVAEKPDSPVSPLGLEMVFYKDNGTNTYHGTLYGYLSHMPEEMRQQREPDIVSFYFKDVHPVPALTPEVLTYIRDQAKVFGWDFQGLRSYATVFTVMPQPRSPIMARRSPSLPITPSA